MSSIHGSSPQGKRANSHRRRVSAIDWAKQQPAHEPAHEWTEADALAEAEWQAYLHEQHRLAALDDYNTARDEWIDQTGYDAMPDPLPSWAGGLMAVAKALLVHPDLRHKGAHVLARDSSSGQDVDSLIRGLRAEVRALGIPVRSSTSGIESGKLDLDDRELLERAFRRARGGFLIVPAACRLIRHPDYKRPFLDPHHPDYDPDRDPGAEARKPLPSATDEQWQGLRRLARKYSVIVLTLADPDVPLGKAVAFLRELRKLGSNAGRPRKYGPGWRKALREEYTPVAAKEHANGMSLQDISDLIFRETGYEVSRQTISNWIRHLSNI